MSTTRSHRKPLVYLVTCREWPHGEAGTTELRKHLREVGICAELASWDDTSIDWTKADLVAVRSTWDYHEHLDRFVQWAANIKPRRFLHGSQVFQWNANKRYLLQLQAKGVPTIPTVYVEDLTALASASVETMKNVIKPAVGASGVGVEVFVPNSRPWHPTSPAPWVIQPFVESVRTEGETTVFIIDGKPTGQLVQTNEGIDFRIHPEYSGKARSVPLTEEAQKVALAAYAATEDILGTKLFYARLDLLRHDGQLMVSEVEITEPCLYMDVMPENIFGFVKMVQRILLDDTSLTVSV